MVPKYVGNLACSNILSLVSFFSSCYYDASFAPSKKC